MPTKAKLKTLLGELCLQRLLFKYRIYLYKKQLSILLKLLTKTYPSK